MDEIWAEVEGIEVGLVDDRQAIIVKAADGAFIHDHSLCKELGDSGSVGRTTRAAREYASPSPSSNANSKPNGWNSSSRATTRGKP